MGSHYLDLVTIQSWMETNVQLLQTKLEIKVKHDGGKGQNEYLLTCRSDKYHPKNY